MTAAKTTRYSLNGARCAWCCSVLLPAAVYVLGIQLIGIYVASAAYIAVFMVWLGKYGWTRGLIVGVGVSAVTFAMFEIWFQVPLFKGEFNPLSLIGY